MVRTSLRTCFQDDLLYESLTVYETLYYAAMLRLPQHMDHSAKTDRVDTVIAALGLVSCKDTIIGELLPSLSIYSSAVTAELGTVLDRHCDSVALCP